MVLGAHKTEFDVIRLGSESERLQACLMPVEGQRSSASTKSCRHSGK
jgi:hypothetical protein